MAQEEEEKDRFEKVEGQTQKPCLLANVDTMSGRVLAILKIAIPTVLTGLI